MRKYILSGVFALIISSMSTLAQVPTYVEASPDLGPQLQFAVPGIGDYDLYDSGLILEVQFRDWVSEPWGYLLAIGYGQWESADDANKPGANLYDFNGDIELVPFGGSVLFKIYEVDEISVVLDAGLRYYATDSKISARNYDQPAENKYDVEIDDALVGLVGASVDYVLNEDFILTVGASFQLDVSKGSLSTELGPGVDNSFEAFVIDLAIRMPL